MASESPDKQDTAIARLAVESGMVQPADIAQAQQELQSASGRLRSGSLAGVLVRHGKLSTEQAEALRTRAAAAAASTGSSQQIPGFVILSKLGSGAMATVFKARQVNLDRLVAIKVLPRRLAADAEYVDRFYKEGRAAAQLNHPNIVQAYDVGQAGEYHYFVMEYVDGSTVHDELAERQMYTEVEALRVVIPIAQALEHAHERGFVHRDVKPKNIMLTAQRVPKLADLGLAREVGDAAAAAAEKGKALGTPYYISPEQIRGQTDVDFRADIYSLGATLYHMVTGRVPFNGEDGAAVMARHLKSRLKPADHINRSLSSGIGQIIEMMMAKKREERYRSTAELIEDLQAVAGGQAPMYARSSFDTDILAHLAKSERYAPAVAGPAPPPPPEPKILPDPRVGPLAAGLAASVLLNITLLLILLLS